MLLSKREKKYNLIYILTLFITVISFYINILSSVKLVIASLLTMSLLYLLTIIHYNTFKKPLKFITSFLYLLFIIWMISNKIYFAFFGDYINLVRIFSAAAPSIITANVFTVVKNISVLVLIISSIINYISFRKAKFRYKKYHVITIFLYIFYFAITLILRTYNYEILSCIVTSSIGSSYDDETYKPITSSNENMFDKIKNKEHVNNDYTGICEGKNLILVQCESLQNVFTNKTYNNGQEEYEITPTINELIKNDTLYFNNCFAQIGWGNTSDAEFIVNNSFYPLAMQSIYQRCINNNFYGLPKILNKNGYTSSVYHGYIKEMWNRDIFYPVEGFSSYYHSENFPTDQFIGFGIADREFFKQATSYMKDKEGKTFDFLITLSSHTPFNTDASMSNIKLSKLDNGTLFGNYLINVNYLDSAIKIFIEQLKEKGLYDNSIIVFYGDHQGLNKSDNENYKNMTRYLSKPYQYDDMLNIPLLIHIPGLGESKTITTTCGQMDIMPTVLNLLGIENDTIYFGEDILSLPEDSSRAIGGTTYMPTGSFIDKDYIFIMSDDNIYDHATIIDRATGGNANDVVSREMLYQKSMAIQSDVKLSNTITERNLIEALINNDTIIMNNVNPQPFIFMINNDKDDYNYIDRLNKAIENNYNLIACKVYKDEDEFYVNNNKNLFNKLKLIDFLEEVKNHKDVYVILTDIKDIEEDLFRYLGKDHPELSSLCIPEIYSFTDYTKVKTFNMNTPILVLDEINCKVEELINFVGNNELFAVLSTTNKFNYTFISILDKIYNLFTYTKSVSDKGEITYYKNKSIKGFYTENLELGNYKKVRISKFY